MATTIIHQRAEGRVEATQFSKNGASTDVTNLLTQDEWKALALKWQTTVKTMARVPERAFREHCKAIGVCLKPHPNTPKSDKPMKVRPKYKPMTKEQFREMQKAHVMDLRKQLVERGNSDEFLAFLDRDYFEDWNNQAFIISGVLDD